MSSYTSLSTVQKKPISFNEVFFPGITSELKGIEEFKSRSEIFYTEGSDLLEYTKLYQLIANNTSDIIAIYNPDFTFQFISPSVTKVLGFEPFEIIGKRPSELFNVPDDLSPDVPYILQYPHKSEQRKILLETVLKPVYNNGVINSYLATSRDVTSRESIRQELEDALEREKELNQLKSKFISIASHELKTPLTTIASSVEILSIYFQEEQYLKEKLEKHTSRISAQVERLNGIINDVLLIEKSKQPAQETTLDCFNLVAYVHESMEESFGKYFPKNIKISSSEKYISIHSNKKFLYHILKNLTENAIKYSNPDNIQIEIHIESTADCINISVKDHGIGINPKDKHQLFNLFYRSASVDNIDGTGIGLTIVKDCTEKLNAKVSFQSTINKGSTFIISLPKGVPAIVC
jgi:PAS domain S-box-containing protein